MGMKKPGSFTYDYPRPALTADVAVVSRDARPRVLLIRRKKTPFAGKWALPGGFVDENERAADARAVKWWPLDALPPLAFDHAMLLERVRARLQDRAP